MTANSFLTYAALAFAAGALIPVMAKMNASIAAASGNIPLATMTLLAIGTLAAAGAVALSGTAPPSRFPDVPPAYYLGGVVVAFYVLSVTFLVPRFGVGNTIMFVVAAQIISATLIDHFGLMGTQVVSLSPTRGLGVMLMFAGVYLARA